MCTYEDLVDATLPHGLIPLRRAAAAHDHPGRGGHRPGHRVDQLPQRSAARVGAGDGRLHRRRRGRSPPAPATSRLFDTFPNSYGSLGYATRLRIEPRAGAGARRAAPCPLRRRRLLRSAIAEVTEHPASSTASGSTASTESPSSPESTTSRWPGGPRRSRPRPPTSSDYTGQQVFYRSLRERETDRADHATTTCGAGTPTGSGARARSAPSTRCSAGSGRGAGVAPTST